MNKTNADKIARRVGVTKLGCRTAPRPIVLKNRRPPAPPARTPPPHFKTFEEYRAILLAMPPLAFEDQARQLRANVAAGSICDAMRRAFLDVEPDQRPRIEAAHAERERVRVAELQKPRARSEDEQKVDAGTHRWVCEHQKCGGKGQSIAVWSVVLA